MRTMTPNVVGRLTVATGMSVRTVPDPTQSPSASRSNSLVRVTQKKFPRAPTPVRLIRLLPWLVTYPDRAKAEMLLQGFKVGFHVPTYPGPGCFIVSNAKSVDLRKDIVKSKINAEIAEGRIAGPFSSPPFTDFRLSPLAIVPKKEPNSYRLIHNLSFFPE